MARLLAFAEDQNLKIVLSGLGNDKYGHNIATSASVEAAAKALDQAFTESNPFEALLVELNERMVRQPTSCCQFLESMNPDNKLFNIRDLILHQCQRVPVIFIDIQTIFLDAPTSPTKSVAEGVYLFGGRFSLQGLNGCIREALADTCGAPVLRAIGRSQCRMQATPV